MKQSSIKRFQEETGYLFQDQRLLKQALTHSSYANEKHMGRLCDNERLEFLGDAVLELISSEFLFFKDPTMPEGDLTKLRASLVCEPTLAVCAQEIHLGDYLCLGKGENMTGGRERKSILSDALEAVIGAIYLDGGFAKAKEFVLRFILTDIEHKQLFHDSKTTLQELVQAFDHKEELRYRIVREEGPDHNKNFVVEALLGDRVIGQGEGRTKKSAEQEAAYHGILELQKKEETECI